MASRFAHQAIHSAEETVEQMHQVTSRILHVPSISIHNKNQQSINNHDINTATSNSSNYNDQKFSSISGLSTKNVKSRYRSDSFNATNTTASRNTTTNNLATTTTTTTTINSIRNSIQNITPKINVHLEINKLEQELMDVAIARSLISTTPTVTTNGSSTTWNTDGDISSNEISSSMNHFDNNTLSESTSIDVSNVSTSQSSSEINNTTSATTTTTIQETIQQERNQRLPTLYEDITNTSTILAQDLFTHSIKTKLPQKLVKRFTLRQARKLYLEQLQVQECYKSPFPLYSHSFSSFTASACHPNSSTTTIFPNVLQQQDNSTISNNIPYTLTATTGKAKGLPNYGQTCFLNSVLQSLASLSPMIVYLERIVERSLISHFLEFQSRIPSCRGGNSAVGRNNNYDGNGSEGSGSDTVYDTREMMDKTDLDVEGVGGLSAMLLYILHYINQHPHQYQMACYPSSSPSSSTALPSLWRREKVAVQPKDVLDRVAEEHVQFRTPGWLSGGVSGSGNADGSSNAHEQQDAQELLQAVMSMIITESQVEYSTADDVDDSHHPYYGTSTGSRRVGIGRGGRNRRRRRRGRRGQSLNDSTNGRVVHHKDVLQSSPSSLLFQDSSLISIANEIYMNGAGAGIGRGGGMESSVMLSGSIGDLLLNPITSKAASSGFGMNYTGSKLSISDSVTLSDSYCEDSLDLTAHHHHSMNQSITSSSFHSTISKEYDAIGSYYANGGTITTQMLHDKQNGLSSNGYHRSNQHDHQDEAEGSLILDSISSSQHEEYHNGANGSHISLDSFNERILSPPLEHEDEAPKQNDLLTFSTLLTRIDKEQRRLAQLHECSNGQCGQEILASSSSTISSSENHEEVPSSCTTTTESHQHHPQFCSTTTPTTISSSSLSQSASSSLSNLNYSAQKEEKKMEDGDYQMSSSSLSSSPLSPVPKQNGHGGKQQHLDCGDGSQVHEEHCSNDHSNDKDCRMVAPAPPIHLHSNFTCGDAAESQTPSITATINQHPAVEKMVTESTLRAKKDNDAIKKDNSNHHDLDIPGKFISSSLTSTQEATPPQLISTSMQVMVKTLSPITPSPLSGWIGSTLQCCQCGHIPPVRNAPSLEIPIVPIAVSNYHASLYNNSPMSSSHIRHISPTSSFPSCSLEECLSEFTSVETVQDVECRACAIQAELQHIDDEIMLLEGAIETIVSRQKKQSGRSCPSSHEKEEVDDVQDVNVLKKELNQMNERKVFLSNLDPDAEVRKEDEATTVRTYSQSDIDDILLQGNEADLLSSPTTAYGTDSIPSTKLIPKSMRGDAKKRLLLTRLPPILCLHVKRLFYDPLQNDMAKTLQHIDFPEVLDLSPYSAYAGEMTGQWATTASSKSAYKDDSKGVENDDRKEQRTKVPYQLMSVIEHRGNAYAGHYVTYRRVMKTTITEANTKGAGCSSSKRNEKDWVLVSDERVSFLSFHEVQRCQAYMLFYEAI